MMSYVLAAVPLKCLKRGDLDNKFSTKKHLTNLLNTRDTATNNTQNLQMQTLYWGIVLQTTLK